MRRRCSTARPLATLGVLAGLVIGSTLGPAALAPVALASATSATLTMLATAPLAAQAPPTVVFLVRHAERAEDGTSDPPISEAGQARADLVADLLQDAELTHVHTTDYRRTRATARPTADSHGLEPATYDPGDLAGFARWLRDTPGRHLVLGHSNTTPRLVQALGGEAGAPISEMEYDRLYVVTLTPDGVSTVLLRFGERFDG